jgi:S1-C subfamily serine protease
VTPPVPGFLGRILDEAGGPAGTCFQAAPGLLVTAWHVLDGLGKAAAGDVVGVDLLAGGETFAAHVLATDPGHDLAVLRSAGEFPSSVTGSPRRTPCPAGPR